MVATGRKFADVGISANPTESQLLSTRCRPGKPAVQGRRTGDVQWQVSREKHVARGFSAAGVDPADEKGVKLLSTPKARIVTNFFEVRKIELAALDGSRDSILAPGAVFEAGGHRLVPLCPPYHDAPKTCSLQTASARFSPMRWRKPATSVVMHRVRGWLTGRRLTRPGW